MSALSERSQAINTNRGEVFLIGPDAFNRLERKPELQAGDKVYYAKWGAMTLRDEETGEFYVVCNDEDILVGYTNE